MKKTKKKIKINSVKAKKKIKTHFKKNSKKLKKKQIKKSKSIPKKIKKISSKSKKIKLKKTKKVTKKIKSKEIKNSSLILSIINFQNSFKPEIKFKINFNIERYIQAFFDKISDFISQYKTLKKDEARRIKLEKQEKERLEKIEIANEKQKEAELKVKLKEQVLKEEIRLEKQRTKEIKLFLRKEQAILRIEQAEKQKQFLQQLKLDKQIDKFRVREVKELEKLEKISLKEQREDYAGLQERIDRLKEKYRVIRDQKIRERVEALGVSVQEGDDREILLQKEREYLLERQKIENCLESFYRSAASLVFQLNKRHITRNMSIFRCVDRRFETGEIFIKWDEAIDDSWLILIYIKNNSPDEGIIIEDKSNPEKNITHELKTNEIFNASDLMVDSLTQLLARERKKNKKN